MQRVSVTLCDKCRTALVVEERTLPPLTIEQQHSSHLPSDFESSDMRARIEHADRDLERYDAEIDRLSKVLDTLKKQKGNLQEYRNCCRALFAPIRKLPMEILIEIFSRTCRPPGLSNSIKKLEASALAIAQTCSFWRDIALHAPNLWSTIVLNISFDQNGVLELYLARSKPAALTLDLRSQGRYRPASPSMLLSLLDAGDRWLTASVDFICINNLHSLEIDRFPRDINKVNGLRQLIVRPSQLSYDGDSGLSRSDILWLFRYYPCLRDIDFAIRPSPIDQFQTDIAPFLHNELRSFTCQVDFSPQLADAIISSATLPALATVDLCSTQWAFWDCSHSGITSDRVLGSLMGMLERSHCRLQVLRLTHPVLNDMSKEALISILRLTPTLSELSLCIYRLDGIIHDLFQLLTLRTKPGSLNIEHSTIPMLLPHLKIFHVELWSGFYYGTAAYTGSQILPERLLEYMYSMLVSRIASFEGKTEKLACFKLILTLHELSDPGHEWAQAFQSMEPRFGSLRADGLEVSLTAKYNGCSE